MGDVIVSFKVLPKDVEVDLDKLEQKIKETINPDRIDRQPIAFGLVALFVIKIIPDAGGELDKVENKLKTIEEVSQVEISGLTKAL